MAKKAKPSTSFSRISDEVRRHASLLYLNHDPAIQPSPAARAPKSNSQITRLFPIYVDLDLKGRDWRELKPGERWQKVGELYKNEHDEELGRNPEREAFKRYKVKHP
jgi:hypothetical protein